MVASMARRAARSCSDWRMTVTAYMCTLCDVPREFRPKHRQYQYRLHFSICQRLELRFSRSKMSRFRRQNPKIFHPPPKKHSRTQWQSDFYRKWARKFQNAAGCDQDVITLGTFLRVGIPTTSSINDTSSESTENAPGSAAHPLLPAWTAPAAACDGAPRLTRRCARELRAAGHSVCTGARSDHGGVRTRRGGGCLGL